MASKIPDDPNALLGREATAAALQESGFRVQSKSLQTMATRGGGPPFQKFGKYVVYRWGTALEWAMSKLSAPMSSTSELDAAPKPAPKRDERGRYDHENDWDRLCVCGHTLGVHAAGSPADCLLHSFAERAKERVSHAKQPDANCGCLKFRPRRSKGKFVYLVR